LVHWAFYNQHFRIVLANLSHWPLSFDWDCSLGRKATTKEALSMESVALDIEWWERSPCDQRVEQAIKRCRCVECNVNFCPRSINHLLLHPQKNWFLLLKSIRAQVTGCRIRCWSASGGVGILIIKMILPTKPPRRNQEKTLTNKLVTDTVLIK
jgi:hypothetical protein